MLMNYLFVMYIIYNNLAKTLTIISNLNKKNTELRGSVKLSIKQIK